MAEQVYDRHFAPTTSIFMNKRYARFKEAGLCRRCGKTPLPGKTRCKRCHRLHLEYGRRFKNRAIRHGLCRYCCKEPRIASCSMCTTCLRIHSARSSARHAKWRKACLKAYGGHCVCCGCHNPKYLQLDHVNDDGAEHRRQIANGSRGGSLYKWAYFNGFPHRLQLMCGNCHQAKSCFGGCTKEDHPPFKS